MPSELAHDAQLYGAFFDRPITLDGVTTPGGGGFSVTFFQRSQECTVCGNCCRNQFRESWYWFDFEDKPDVDLKMEQMRINDESVPIWVHYNKAGPKVCDFLDQETNGCSIHFDGTKPVHCLGAPQVAVFHIQGRYFLSKRLPGRNWRWPMCPIVMADTPVPGEAEKAMDREILSRYTRALGHLKDCLLPEILECYDRFYDLNLFYKASGGKSTLKFVDMLAYNDADPREPL